jgi:hypothetical protein
LNTIEALIINGRPQKRFCVEGKIEELAMIHGLKIG